MQSLPHNLQSNLPDSIRNTLTQTPHNRTTASTPRPRHRHESLARSSSSSADDQTRPLNRDEIDYDSEDEEILYGDREPSNAFSRNLQRAQRFLSAAAAVGILLMVFVVIMVGLPKYAYSRALADLRKGVGPGGREYLVWD